MGVDIKHASQRPFRPPLPAHLALTPAHHTQATMASKRATRSLLAPAAPLLRCAHSSRPALVRTSACAFSTTTPSRAPGYDAEAADRPRWQQTPPRMQAPFRIRPAARGGVFKVNEDPKRLDDAYVKLLGPGGDKVLDEEAKWLAVTHKSFDHGRRGFNDRLAYLGMCCADDA